MSDCGQCIVLYDWLLNSRFVSAVNANIESICKMCVPFSFVVYTLLWIPVISLLLGWKCSTLVRDEHALLLSFDQK